MHKFPTRIRKMATYLSDVCLQVWAVSTLYSYRYFPVYLKFETVIIVNILLTLIREAEHPDLT